MAAQISEGEVMNLSQVTCLMSVQCWQSLIQENVLYKMLISQSLWFWFFGCRDLYCSFYVFKKGIKRNNLLIRIKKILRIYFRCSSATLPIFSAEWFFLQQCNECSFLSSHFLEKNKPFPSPNEECQGVNLLFPHINGLGIRMYGIYSFFFSYFSDWICALWISELIQLCCVRVCAVYLANPFYV